MYANDFLYSILNKKENFPEESIFIKGNLINLKDNGNLAILLVKSAIHDFKSNIYDLKGNLLNIKDIKEKEPIRLEKIDKTENKFNQEYFVFESYDSENSILKYSFFKELRVNSYIFEYN